MTRNGNDTLPDLALDPTVCPKHDVPLIQKTGRGGFFMACPEYPRCRHTVSLPKPANVAAPEADKDTPIEDMIDTQVRVLLRRVEEDDGTGKLPPVNQAASALALAMKWHMFKKGVTDTSEFGSGLGGQD